MRGDMTWEGTSEWKYEFEIEIKNRKSECLFIFGLRKTSDLIIKKGKHLPTQCYQDNQIDDPFSMPKHSMIYFNRTLINYKIIKNH